ncbi:MAG: flagellar brake protein [Wenzhouxiangella sp.]
MDSVNLGLEVGDSLQLQFVNDTLGNRHYVKVLGCHPGRSIIVGTPQVAGRIMLVRQDQAVIVRLMIGNDVVGFNSTVLRSCARPYPYLHLAFPKELQSSSVRKALRVSLDAVVSLRRLGHDDQPDRLHPGFAGRTRDISTTGALVSSSARLGGVGDRLSMAMQVAVAGFSEEIRLLATVRNTAVLAAADETAGTLYGIEFDPPERREAILLHGHVYQTILQHMGKMAAPFADLPGTAALESADEDGVFQP